MLNDLILYFVDRLPNSGRTQIVKYLYLADLESRRHRGQSLTNLIWIKHNHGPFDSRILSALDALRTRKLLIEEHIEYPNGFQGSLYRTSRTPKIAFDDATQSILDVVVKQYGALGLRQLLDDVVYESKPMQSAVEKHALDMSCVDNEAAIHGISLEDAWKGFRDTQEGRTVPFEEAFRQANSG